jgi:type IV pilus assembly protein PilQ
MSYGNKKYPWIPTACVLVFILFLSGCAGKTVAKDPFLEKWSTMAETKAGNSPVSPERTVSIMQQLLQENTETGGELKAATIHELPKQPISLKLRQADVRTVLRSLARIVDKNVIVKSEIKGETTIDFREVPWDQAFTSILNTHGLTYVWDGDIIRIMTLEDSEQDLKRKTQEQGIQWVEPLLTVVVPINYIASDKLAVLKGNLETFLTRSKDDKPRGSVQVNEYSNSLILSAIKSDLMRMIPVIEKIDKPTPQIQIRANIVETTKDTARSLGIQWGGMYNPRLGNHDLWVTPGGTAGSTTTNPTGGGYTPVVGDTGISGQGFGVNFPAANAAITAAGGAASLGLMFGSIGGNILDLQLSALQSDGKLNILSSPSITTMDNQKAFTENGEKVPFSTLDTSTVPPTRTVKFEDAVLRLEITPHVIDGRYLSMKILVKKDEVDMSRTVEGNPFIIKKQTETSLIVQDGETIVISGLTKKRTLDGTSGIPWLKEIPVLGWLFKGEDKAENMEEVLIFITPRILPATVAEMSPGAGGRPAGTDAGAKPNAEKIPN